MIFHALKFDTKMLLVPQNGVRYREVPAISVRYKEFFCKTMTAIPSVRMSSVCYRKVSAIEHVRYVEVSL